MKELLIGFLMSVSLTLIAFVIFALPQIIDVCEERKRLREIEREKIKTEVETLTSALNMQMLIYEHEIEPIKKNKKLDGKENHEEWNSFKLPTIENKENEDHSTDW